MHDFPLNWTSISQAELSMQRRFVATFPLQQTSEQTNKQQTNKQWNSSDTTQRESKCDVISNDWASDLKDMTP
jgi:hypothetical protein